MTPSTAHPGATAGAARTEDHGPTPGTLERDRRAILAMAGTFRIRFHFEETVPLAPGYDLALPYDTKASAERVEILVDEPQRIVLQHLLVVGGGVVKHWRQDWEYEARDLHDYVGGDAWEHRRASADEARGAWVQSVWQVDDSPRYQGRGRWVHEGAFSVWESDWTGRPLPRRESARGDYHLLRTRNRHTSFEDRWVHEQDSVKIALSDDGRSTPLVRELGINHYDRIDPSEGNAAGHYWGRYRAAWAEVRAAWDAILAPGTRVRILGRGGDDALWKDVDRLVTNGHEGDLRELRGRVDALLSERVRVEPLEAPAAGD